MNGKKRTSIALGLSAFSLMGAAAMALGIASPAETLGNVSLSAISLNGSSYKANAATVYDNNDVPAYSHTVTYQEAAALKFMGVNEFTASNLGWTFYTEGSLGDYVEGKGIGFDSECETVTLFSEAFRIDNKTLINKVVVNASRGEANEGASISLLVNGSEAGTKDLSNEAADYEFSLDEPTYGSVEIVLNQSSASTKDALYLCSISIYAEEDETGSQILPAIQALDEIKTCEVEGGDLIFADFVAVFQGTIDTYESVLSEIYLRDYASLDTSYAGNKTGRVSFMDKYSYCLERYNAGSASSLLSLSSGEENIYVAACALLSLSTASIATFLILKKRKAA